MLRILPQELVNAYKGKDLKPGKGSVLFYSGRSNILMACGIGAIAYKPGDEKYIVDGNEAPDGYQTLYERMNKLYGTDYVDGFIVGFDEHTLNMHRPPHRYLQGYYDAQEARRAVKKAFL